MNWLKFFNQNRIPFVTSGPNTGRNYASIKCPFCGDADHSEHLGVNLKGTNWRCLRNQSHRGPEPTRLIRQLLHCTEEEAKRLAGMEEAAAVTADELGASLDGLRAAMGTKVPPKQALTLSLPKEFKPLMSGSIFAEPYLSYLADRGYRPAQVKWLAEHYNLHYTQSGRQAGRIIIPIYDRFGSLLSWTGRAISPDVIPRYKTLRTTGDGDGEPVALIPANGTILGLPVLWAAENPRVLLLVEGPFDALKVTAFGSSLGVYAACLFGLAVYPAQLAEVEDLRERFDAIYLLIDEDAKFQRLRLMQALRPAGVQALSMPPDTDDPGALTAGEVTKLCLEVLSR